MHCCPRVVGRKEAVYADLGPSGGFFSCVAIFCLCLYQELKALSIFADGWWALFFLKMNYATCRWSAVGLWFSY